METVKKFLLAPDENEDAFWNGDALIWIDWREYDEDIIGYFNDKLPEEDKIQFACVEIEKERGVDILLKKNGISTAIPYAEDCTDRDTTLKSIQAYIDPKYQIRWYMGSLGSDTLAFCIGLTSQWEQLEYEFGSNMVGYYFASIDPERKMFDLDMDEIFSLAELRSKNKNIDFDILENWVKISTKEKELKRRKANGEIDLKYYLEAKNKIKKEKEDFIKKHQELRF